MKKSNPLKPHYHLVRAVDARGVPYGEAVGHIEQYQEGAAPWIAFCYNLDDVRITLVGRFGDKEAATRAIRMAHRHGCPLKS